MKREKRRLIKPWATRQFLRPRGDSCGPGSVIQADVSAIARAESKYDPKTDDYTATGRQCVCIEANLSFRDCSSEVSFGFYSSNKRKHAVKQHKAILKIQKAVEMLEACYAEAIRKADEEDLWHDE